MNYYQWEALINFLREKEKKTRGGKKEKKK